MRNFGVGSMLNNLKVKPHNIVLAFTTPIDYEMSRYILLEDVEGLEYDEYLLLEGHHCSCYDFDESEWEATAYKRGELLTLANAPYNEDDRFWQMVKLYL